MLNKIVPTNLRVRIVGNKARQAVYTTPEYIGGLYSISMAIVSNDHYWYIIPNHQDNRIGTFQIQNTVTHQNLYMKSGWVSREGEVGTSGPDISKDDQAIRLIPGKGVKAGLYRFECGFGDSILSLYCRDTWQPPTLGCLSGTTEYDDQWFSFEFEPLDFVGVDYDLGKAVIHGRNIRALFSQTQTNDSDTEQKQIFKISETMERQSIWEVESGLDLGVKMETECSVPCLASEKLEVSATVKVGFTTGKTVTTTDSWEAEVPLICPSKKSARCLASVVESTIEVPCTTTYKSKETGEDIKISGIYKGTGSSDFATHFELVPSN